MTPLTIEKIAVLAPMPSASVSRAGAVKPGDRRSRPHGYLGAGAIALVQLPHSMDDLPSRAYCRWTKPRARKFTSRPVEEHAMTRLLGAALIATMGGCVGVRARDK